jgi:hypothetical protein
MSGYIYDMDIYLEDGICATADITETRATVKQLTKNEEGLRHKVYIDCPTYLTIL